MSKNKKNSKFKEFILKQKQMQNDLKEFSNKHDLGQCIFVSLSKNLLLTAEGYEPEFVKNKFYSLISQIYAYIINSESSNQTIKDWVNKDIKMSIKAMKKDIKEWSENNE